MKKRSDIISVFCILAAAVTLYDCSSFFAPYLIASVYALYCLYKTSSLKRQDRSYRIILIVSFITAVFITLANYGLWLHPHMPDIRTSAFVRVCKLLLILIIMSGSFCAVRAILIHVVYDRDAFVFPGTRDTKREYLFFFIPFAVISVIYLTVFFCCYYPGLLSPDSIDQVTQIFTGKYSNHQPFFHTMILSAFLRTGLAVWNDINRAVAFYSVFQVLFLAFSFAFTVYTMAKLRIPVWCEIAATAYYALMPYHIMYSYTLWKDVYFGAFTTLMIVFTVRLTCGLGSATQNRIGFAISSLVICLIRSNGLFAYVIFFIVVILLMRKDKKTILTMLAIIIVSFAAKHVLLSSLNVTAPDTVESLSIPLQQISRVIADDGNVAEQDLEFLEQIIDVSSIKEIYDPGISDPIKNAIRDFGNQSYLSQNMGSFAMLYLRTFIHNPTEYVIAWVDITCGYWNSGYDYWIWYWDVEENGYGIIRSINSPRVLNFMDEYLWLFYNNRILQIFTSMGLFVWILMLVLAKGIAAFDRTVMIACVPPIAIILSLVISSPVYSEFRYMYALFSALPLIYTLPGRGISSAEDTDSAAVEKEQ